MPLRPALRSPLAAPTASAISASRTSWRPRRTSSRTTSLSCSINALTFACVSRDMLLLRVWRLGDATAQETSAEPSRHYQLRTRAHARAAAPQRVPRRLAPAQASAPWAPLGRPEQLTLGDLPDPLKRALEV